MTYLFLALPCHGYGAQKERVVQQAIDAARAIGDFELTVTAMFNRGVCYWNDTPANFERALDSFVPFREALAPYTDPRYTDTPEKIRSQVSEFRDQGRRYLRFLENAYRVATLRRSSMCGPDGARCMADAWALTQRVKARLFHSRMLQAYVATDQSGGLRLLLARQLEAGQAAEARRLGMEPLAVDGSRSVLDGAAIRAELNRSYPGYMRLYESLTPTVDQLRAALDDDEVYLSYILTDDHRSLLAFRITKREPALFVRLDISADQLRTLIEQIQQAVVTQGSPPSLAPLLRHAASKLLGFAQLPIGSHVIVEADEALSALPFTLLINRDDTVATGHTISYVPSAGIFRNLRTLGPETGSSGYIAFGRTDFGSETVPLPAVAREITAASTLFRQNMIYKNSEARESDIYAHANDLAKVEVLHLATHTEVRDGETALLFHEGDGEDGRLTESDIITKFRTSADLVILSGCDTATLDRQGDIPGESFSALTRAFFAAGAKKLLVTQWPIRDDFAALFVVAFAKSFTSGNGPARALADAQLAVRTLPHATEWDWAGWILVGD